MINPSHRSITDSKHKESLHFTTSMHLFLGAKNTVEFKLALAKQSRLPKARNSCLIGGHASGGNMQCYLKPFGGFSRTAWGKLLERERGKESVCVCVMILVYGGSLTPRHLLLQITLEDANSLKYRQTPSIKQANLKNTALRTFNAFTYKHISTFLH